MITAMRARRQFASIVALMALSYPAEAVIAQSADPAKAIFAAYDKPDSPGCAWGYVHGNAAPVTGASGLADLEHAVPLTAGSIIEAGSVSKQFTAAAILMLVADGKLALTDDVRRFVPEMPDYGRTITIDHLLNHTSGLRDWGYLVQAAGWPRGQRAFTMEDAIRIIARQRSLNYMPGERYSYTNSGYLLLTTIVERVSGQKLAAFTKARMFDRLGMLHTSWRDNFRTVVPGRAIAYSSRGDAFQQDMPFDDVYGAGALLTTVGDLLIWNAALDSGKLGEGFADRMAEQAILSGGKAISYGRGLWREEVNGVRLIGHSGSTAGYRAWLARYPERKLSVAVLCNNGAAKPVADGKALAARLLKLPEPAALGTNEIPRPTLAGRFANDIGTQAIDVAIVDGVLTIDGRDKLMAEAPTRFSLGTRTFIFESDDRIVVSDADSDTAYNRVRPIEYGTATLATFLGRFVSEEVSSAYRIEIRGNQLHAVVDDRPQISIPLKASHADTFVAPDLMVHFLRDSRGQVNALTMSTSRLSGLRFDRM